MRGWGWARPRGFVGAGERRESPGVDWSPPLPFLPPVNVLGGVGPWGSLSVLGQPSPGRRCSPPLLAPSRRSFRASGEAVFDLHFLLSHGARAAASPVTPRSRPAWRRRLQREISCVSSPARHAWPPRGGFPAALPSPPLPELRPRADPRPLSL